MVLFESPQDRINRRLNRAKFEKLFDEEHKRLKQLNEDREYLTEEQENLRQDIELYLADKWEDYTTTANMLFVTLSLKDCALSPEVFQGLNATMAKAASKKWIQMIEYTYEQRGETVATMGSGLHIHAIVQCKTTKAPSQAIKEFYSTFKGYMESVRFVNVKKVVPGTLSELRDYIEGIKEDSKLPKVVIDKQMRTKYELKQVFKLGDP